MRVTLLTIGFRGDVEPVVALGGALTHRGHEVGVAAAPEFEAMVRGAGLDFSPVGPPAAELLGDGAGQRLISGAGGVCGQARQMGRLIDEWAGRLADDALTAVEGSDALLFTPAANVGRVAEALGIPSMMISLWPKSRTGEFPAIGFPDLGVLGAGYNRLTHVLLEQLAWRPLQRAGNRIRTRLGLPPLRWQTPLGRDHREGRPVLYGFSEHVLPRPPDWRAWLHVCGYWFLDPPEGWRPPSDVTSFLEAGEPPVAITFGSMSTLNAQWLGECAVEALRRAGRRGILIGPLQPRGGDEQILCVPEVPHHWLFPRTAAVVHHGGAGTTAASLRAGAPSVAVPFFADQPFWARRLERLGAGVWPMSLRQLTSDRLAAAIGRAVDEPPLRHQAGRIGHALRHENGPERAATVVEHEFTAAPTSLIA